MFRAFAASMLCLAFAACSFAEGKGKGQGKDRKKGEGIVFVEQDRRLILEHYQPGSGGLPPGLAKRGGDLPPGLQKQLRRKGTLPPGLQKRLVLFPPELEARLSPLPPGYRRGTIGTVAVLIHDAANVIADIVELTRRP